MKLHGFSLLHKARIGPCLIEGIFKHIAVGHHHAQHLRLSVSKYAYGCILRDTLIYEPIPKPFSPCRQG